jgi:UDP-GlcNAc:undecaprenyl-phosphate GlcNAc-1-phosphate transferase
VVAWFSVSLTQRGGASVPPPVMLWVLGLVLMDVFTVTVRRLARRRSPMAADRDHIHHMLLRRGYGPWQTLGMLVGANLALAAIGAWMWHAGVPDRWIFWSYLAVCAVYFALFFMPFRLYRLRARAASVDDYERD